MSQVGGSVDDDLKLIVVLEVPPRGNLALDEYLPIGSIDSRVRKRVGGIQYLTITAGHHEKQNRYQQHRRQYLNRRFFHP
ncbi:hypothetical protein IJ118_02410 [Candidatus Saccharibacteria bacterium]|nr:hypothetical protein [Candidatus Saccharibacteria bacterium]